MKMQQGKSSDQSQTEDRVRIYGSLIGRKLSGLRAFVAGPVYIQNEITDCDLDIAGCLTAEAAVISGCVLMISGSATVGTLGAADGTRTIVMIDHSAHLEHLGNIIEARLTQFDGLVNDKKNEVEKFQEQEKAGGLSSSEREKMTEILCEELPTVEAEKEQLKERMEHLVNALLEKKECHLRVNTHIHPGVVIATAGARLEFTKALEGAHTITYDESTASWTTEEVETKKAVDLSAYARGLVDAA